MSINSEKIFYDHIKSNEVLEQFVRNHGSKYPKCENVTLERLKERLGSKWISMTYYQIYSLLGLLQDRQDIYKGYCEAISSIMPIEGEILDVAAGYIPAFSLKLLQFIIPGRGRVTACDPAMWYSSEHDNLILAPQKFEDCNIESFDLILSVMPCSITKSLLKKAIEADKDIAIGLCACPPNDYMGDDYLGESIEYAKELCKERKRKIIITQMDEKYGVHLPIIASVKR